MNANPNKFSEPQRILKADIDRFAAALEEQRQRAIRDGVAKELARRRCKHCKHWHAYREELLTGNCSSERVLQDCGWATRGGTDTVADFGCVHFEEKDLQNL
jgi:hypothetical protein